MGKATKSVRAGSEIIPRYESGVACGKLRTGITIAGEEHLTANANGLRVRAQAEARVAASIAQKGRTVGFIR
jgi:hypothetical protein